MIATAIIGAAGSILGNVLQRRAQERAYERQRDSLRRDAADNEAFYNRRYYEDATQRADTMRQMTRAREAFRSSNRAAMGRNAVMGGTNATAAAAKEASNQAYADMVSQAAAAAETRKDKVEDAYLEQKRSLNGAQRTLDNTNDQANAEAIGAMATQVGQLAASAVQNTPDKPNSIADVNTQTVAAPPVSEAQQQQLNLSTPVVAGQSALGMQHAARTWDIMNSGVSDTAALGDKVRQMEHSGRWGKLFG